MENINWYSKESINWKKKKVMKSKFFLLTAYEGVLHHPLNIPPWLFQLSLQLLPT